MRRYLRRPFCPRRRLPAAALPALLTFLAAVMLFARVSTRLQPLVETIAVSNAVNQISLAVNAAVAESMPTGESPYTNFVDVMTDSEGRVSSLSFKSLEGNEFKSQFITNLYRLIEGIESQDLSIPLGNLSGILWLSAMGPDVRVLVRSVGDVSANYENEFTAVGINQTRHSLYLRVSVTMQLMIPGKIIPVTSEERICIAETVIVGEVPDAYLNLQDGE